VCTFFFFFFLDSSHCIFFIQLDLTFFFFWLLNTAAIHDLFVVGMPFSLCDEHGKLNITLLEAICQQHAQKDLLGWFRIRRNTTAFPSMRETAIHQQLSKFHARKHADSLVQSPFVFGVLVSGATANRAIHTFEHVFYYFVKKTKRWNPVALVIANLAQDTANEYASFDAFSAIPTQKTTDSNDIGSTTTSALQGVVNDLPQADFHSLFQAQPPTEVTRLENVFQSVMARMVKLSATSSEVTAKLARAREQNLKLKRERAERLA
jgi:BRCA1-A complex subunit Abraxas 1 MPN domain